MKKFVTGVRNVKMVEMTADEFEGHLTLNYKLGIVSLLEKLSFSLLQKAGKEFAASRDKDAEHLRGLAEEFRKIGEEERKEFERMKEDLEKYEVRPPK